MSKEKIHIDQLFGKLKGYQHPVDGGFGEVNNKLHDAAWADKFEDYEHPISDLPDFGALALPVSDKGIKPKAAKYGLLLLLLTLLSFGGYYGFKKMRGSEPISKNNNFISNHESSKNNTLTQDIKSDNSSKDDESNIKTNESQLTDKPYYIEKSGLAASEGTATNFSDNKIDPSRTHTPTLHNGTNLSQGSNSKNESNKGKFALETNQKFSHADKGSPNFGHNNNNNNNKLSTLNLSSIPFSQNLVKRSLTELPISNLVALKPFSEKIKKGKLPPPRVTYYAQLGLGALSPNNPFTYSAPQKGVTFQGHIGASLKRFSAYTGFEHSEFNYQTTARTLQIYDSFPHLGPGNPPDTIGWFKKNFRDTTVNQTNSSKVIINTIPLHFQFKALQIKKFNFQIGTGLNINIIKPKVLWVNDMNGRLVNNASAGLNGSAKVNLGVSLLGRIGFNISPLTEIYTRVNLREASNILGSDGSSLKPRGTQLDLGIRYHLK